MEENVLIQSSHYNIKKFSIIMSIVGIVLSAFILISTAISNYDYYSKQYHKEEWEPNWLCDCTEGSSVKLEGIKYYIKPAVANREEFEKRHPNVMSYIECKRGGVLDGEEVAVGSIPLLLVIIAVFLYLWLSSYQLIVTDKRVYGKAAFGKRVDLPFDKISAVGTSFLKGIDVGTSSGRIKFKLIKNQEDIHSVMSKLLMERQQKETKNTVIENTIPTSNADELKKFKELLDSGIITREEFDEKKKQLLGL